MNISLKNEPNSSIAVPLRLIEVYTSRETYCLSFDDQTQLTQLLLIIWSYLVDNGYFIFIRSIINVRIPEPYEETIKPPTPIADALFNLVIGPLNLNCKNSTSIVSKMVKLFFEHFLKDPLTPQIQLFFIPKLVHEIPCLLKPYYIFSSFFGDPNFTFSSSIKPTLVLTPNIWLMYSVVKFISSQLSLLSFEDKFKYLLILQHLSISLPEEVEKSESEEDLDDNEPMEVQEYGEGSSTTHDPFLITNHILAIINETAHVDCLIYLIENRVYCASSLNLICYFCHAILATSKLAVLQNRYFSKLFSLILCSNLVLFYHQDYFIL